MRPLLKRLARLSALLGVFASTAALAQGPTPNGRVVLVLPFDNRSGNASLNWIGDSFPDTLDKRLNSVNFLTISRDDRAYALDHLDDVKKAVMSATCDTANQAAMSALSVINRHDMEYDRLTRHGATQGARFP